MTDGLNAGMAESVGRLDEHGGGGDEPGSGFHPAFVESVGGLVEVIVPVQERNPATRIDETPVIIHGQLVSAIRTGSGRAPLQGRGYGYLRQVTRCRKRDPCRALPGRAVL